jgi:K+-transporting ATPase ATPase C chain
MKTLLVALRINLVTLVLCGLLYPLVTTGIAQTVFHDAANGSLVTDDTGKVVGSSLIAQPFANPAYFHPRPSAAGVGYDPTASSGSNLGPTSSALRERVSAAVATLRAENPDAHGEVPAELVTTSGSGLDPDLSPEGALWEVPRIAKARSVTTDRVQKVVLDNVEGRDLGFMGEPRVNVLALNLALDRQFGPPPPPPPSAPLAQ